MSEPVVELVITKSPDFKLFYSSGIFGGLNPLDARMTFFVDRVMPKVDASTPGQMRTGVVERELQVEIHMSPQQFISICHWMQRHIERMEKEGVLVKKEPSV
jgi:hypothetical protein